MSLGYRISDPAEAQAIGLCWLARQSGLPDAHTLRAAVAQLHETDCGWCAYPLPELMGLLRSADVPERAQKAWWAMAGKARLKAIEAAAGRDDARP
jgi:hypothetical protein